MDTELEILHNRFCDYAFTFKGNTKKTLSWYRTAFKSYVKSAKVSRAMEISRVNVETWILEGKRDRNWAPKTIHGWLKSLGLFCKWLKRDGYIPHNPLDEIDLPKLPKTLPRNLTRDQAELLMKWVRNYPYAYKFEKLRAEAIITTFLFTGLRVGELISLEYSDVDMVDRTISVRNGKGMKDRIIPMNISLIPFFDAYLTQRVRLKKACPYFFTDMRKDSKMSQTVVQKLVQKLRKKSKIDFSAHKLRHTFAVLMLEGGCNLYALSKMMGHSDIKTTTIYLSASVSHLHEQMGKHPLDASR